VRHRHSKGYARRVDARRHHAQSLVFSDLVANSGAAEKNNVLYARLPEQRLNMFGSRARQPGIGHQDVGAAEAALRQPPSLFDLIGEVFGPQISVPLAREFALDDELPSQRLARLLEPGSRKRAIAPAIGGIQKGFHRLAEDFTGGGQAQLLEAVPSEAIYRSYMP
jgi:hypothetical protein